MDIVVLIGFLAVLFHFLIRFARQEQVQEDYEDTIEDVECRLDWARCRTFFPFGMKAQLEVSHELLGEAKCLWKEDRWHQAYRVALQSQEAMNKAQSLYCAVVESRQRSR